MSQEKSDAEIKLELFVLDYLVTRKLRQTATTFVREAEITNDPASALHQPGRGLLRDWWDLRFNAPTLRVNDSQAAAYAQLSAIKSDGVPLSGERLKHSHSTDFRPTPQHFDAHRVSLPQTNTNHQADGQLLQSIPGGGSIAQHIQGMPLVMDGASMPTNFGLGGVGYNQDTSGFLSGWGVPSTGTHGNMDPPGTSTSQSGGLDEIFSGTKFLPKRPTNLELELGMPRMTSAQQQQLQYRQQQLQYRQQNLQQLRAKRQQRQQQELLREQQKQQLLQEQQKQHAVKQAFAQQPQVQMQQPNQDFTQQPQYQQQHQYLQQPRMTSAQQLQYQQQQQNLGQLLAKQQQRQQQELLPEQQKQQLLQEQQKQQAVKQAFGQQPQVQLQQPEARKRRKPTSAAEAGTSTNPVGLFNAVPLLRSSIGTPGGRFLLAGNSGTAVGPIAPPLMTPGVGLPLAGGSGNPFGHLINWPIDTLGDGLLPTKQQSAKSTGSEDSITSRKPVDPPASSTDTPGVGLPLARDSENPVDPSSPVFGLLLARDSENPVGPPSTVTPGEVLPFARDLPKGSET